MTQDIQWMDEESHDVTLGSSPPVHRFWTGRGQRPSNLPPWRKAINGSHKENPFQAFSSMGPMGLVLKVHKMATQVLTLFSPLFGVWLWLGHTFLAFLLDGSSISGHLPMDLLWLFGEIAWHGPCASSNQTSTRSSSEFHLNDNRNRAAQGGRVVWYCGTGHR